MVGGRRVWLEPYFLLQWKCIWTTANCKDLSVWEVVGNGVSICRRVLGCLSCLISKNNVVFPINSRGVISASCWLQDRIRHSDLCVVSSPLSSHQIISTHSAWEALERTDYSAEVGGVQQNEWLWPLSSWVSMQWEGSRFKKGTVSFRNGRPTFLSFLRDKGEMVWHAEGMRPLNLTSCSLNPQPKLVNMGVVGWQKYFSRFLLFESSRRAFPLRELAEYLLPIFISADLTEYTFSYPHYSGSFYCGCNAEQSQRKAWFLGSCLRWQ